MYTIFNVTPSEFTADTGQKYFGWHVWVQRDLPNGGITCERLYVSQALSNRLNYLPAVGDTVMIGYRKNSDKLSIIYPV